MHKTHNDEDQPNDHHLHPNHDRRTSIRYLYIVFINHLVKKFTEQFVCIDRPPNSRTSSPSMLEAASNVVEFIKDERFYRNRRGFPHSRYPRAPSSASTSPEPSPNRLSHQDGSGKYARRPLRRWRRGTTTSSSSPCYNMNDTYCNQLNMDSYECDSNVLNGRSRTPSPGKRFGNAKRLQWVSMDKG